MKLSEDFNTTCNVIKKRLQRWCFPVKFLKILKNNFFCRTHLVAVSELTTFCGALESLSKLRTVIIFLNFCNRRLDQKNYSCFRKSSGWKIFYHLPTRISRMCMRIYIFCFQKKQKHTHTQSNTYKKLSTSRFIRANLGFFSSNNKT